MNIEDEDEKKHDFVETYSARYKCGNCYEIGWFVIPKGTTFREFQEKEKCPKCGCANDFQKY